MNLILFELAETVVPLPRTDLRAGHILEVLRRQVGDTFDAGLVDGPRGRATLLAVGETALTLAFAWGEPPPPPAPITLLIGLPRPQTARDILRDTTALGVAALHFVATERSDPGYARSTLWSSGEWRRHLLDGAQQAFDTRLPQATYGNILADTLAGLPAEATRVALDNYEASGPLSGCVLARGHPVILALGPERGWTTRDRTELRAHGFVLAHLGPRVLRAETACVVAVALVRAQLGLM